MRESQFIHTGAFGNNVAYGLQCLLPDHALICTSNKNDLVDSVMSKDHDWQIFLPNCIADFEDSANEQFASFYLLINDEPVEYYTALDVIAKINEIEREG